MLIGPAKNTSNRLTSFRFYLGYNANSGLWDVSFVSMLHPEKWLIISLFYTCIKDDHHLFFCGDNRIRCEDSVGLISDV